MTLRGVDFRRNRHGRCGLLPDRNLPINFSSCPLQETGILPPFFPDGKALPPVSYTSDTQTYRTDTEMEGLACEPRGCVAHVTSLLGDRIRSRGACGYLLRVLQHGVLECEGVSQNVERHDRHAH
jgi:hypothetical protein